MTKESKRAHSTVVQIHWLISEEYMDWHVFSTSTFTLHVPFTTFEHAIRDTRFHCFPSRSFNIKRQQMLGSHRGGLEDPLLCVSWLRRYDQGTEVLHVCKFHYACKHEQLDAGIVAVAQGIYHRCGERRLHPHTLTHCPIDFPHCNASRWRLGPNPGCLQQVHDVRAKGNLLSATSVTSVVTNRCKRLD